MSVYTYFSLTGWIQNNSGLKTMTGQEQMKISVDEFRQYLKLMKNGRAPGSGGNTVESVKAGGQILHNRLVNLLSVSIYLKNGKLQIYRYY